MVHVAGTLVIAGGAVFVGADALVGALQLLSGGHVVASIECAFVAALMGWLGAAMLAAILSARGYGGQRDR